MGVTTSPSTTFKKGRDVKRRKLERKREMEWKWVREECDRRHRREGERERG